MGAQDTNNKFSDGAHADVSLKPEESPMLLLSGMAVTKAKKFSGYGAAYSSIDLITSILAKNKNATAHDHNDTNPRRAPKGDDLDKVGCPIGYKPHPKCTEKQADCKTCPLCPNDGRRTYKITNDKGTVTANQIFPDERAERYYKVCKREPDYTKVEDKLKCCQPWDESEYKWDWLNNAYSNTRFPIPKKADQFNRARCGKDLWDYEKEEMGASCNELYSTFCHNTATYKSDICEPWFSLDPNNKVPGSHSSTNKPPAAPAAPAPAPAAPPKPPAAPDAFKSLEDWKGDNKMLFYLIVFVLLITIYKIATKPKQRRRR